MYPRNEDIWKGYNDDLTVRECNDRERLNCRVQGLPLIEQEGESGSVYDLAICH